MGLGVDDVSTAPPRVGLNDLQGASASDLIMGALAGELRKIERQVLFFCGSDGFYGFGDPLRDGDRAC